MDIAPLAHPQRRDEARTTQVAQLALRLAALDRRVAASRRGRIPVPQLQVRQEVRALVEERAMGLVGRVALVRRPVARVLDRQSAREHQHLRHAVVVARGDDHPCDARIERQASELITDRRQRVRIVERAELVEQLVAVRDRARLRRLDERKVLDLAERERLHPEDHRRERRTQDLGFGERRPRVERHLVVEPDADARGDPTATPRALVRGRPADRLGPQLLHLVAIAVALDAGQAGIDHVADAGDRQRRLRDVGRQHDATRVGRLEHAFLFLGRQAREQRQDLGVRWMVPAQHGRRLADLALAGEEHQHVAGTGPGQLVDRVDDGVDDAAFVGGDIASRRKLAGLRRRP